MLYLIRGFFYGSSDFMTKLCFTCDVKCQTFTYKLFSTSVMVRNRFECLLHLQLVEQPPSLARLRLQIIHTKYTYKYSSLGNTARVNN